MKLIKPSFEITTPINGEQILKEIERAARTCYKSEDKIIYGYFIPPLTNNNEHASPGIENAAISARDLIPKLIARGHEAMLEFGGMITVLFVVDRGVSHELVRHRIASFAQESTRYCNYNNNEHITFIIPPWVDASEGEYVDETDATPAFAQKNPSAYEWYYHMLDSEYRYSSLIELGWSPQQARSVLPNSLKTEINISANIREWRHIFKLRTASGAHPQMREVMIPLLAEFKKQIPILFDDINP
jgi:thymidylate synthase (FAD)